MAARCIWAPETQAYKRYIQAVDSGDAEGLKSALKNDIIVTAQFRENDDCGHTALHGAARYGNVEIIEILLQAGIPVDVLDVGLQPEGGSSTPLFYAARAAKPQAVEALLDAGADLFKKGFCDNSALSYVFWNRARAERRSQDQFDTIVLLLDRGFGDSLCASDYSSLLIEEALRSHSVPFLVEVLSWCPPPDDALYVAAASSAPVTIIKTLLDYGAMDFNHAALAAAAGRNSLETVRLLLDAVMPNADPFPSDPLGAAAHGRHVAMTKMLIEAGIPVNKLSIRNGLTPLHEAVLSETQDIRVVNLLLEAGATCY